MEHLIVRSLQGRASEAEERQLREWRAASAQNEDAFRQMQHLWTLTETARPAESAPRTMRIGSDWKSDRGRAVRWLLQAAAFVAIGLGVARMWSARVELGVLEFATGATEMVTATLSDGSVVRLAQRSRLRFAAEKDRRVVFVSGQAFFAVSKDPTRPFVVRTDLGDATVLGTRFDVRVAPDELRLVVVEGTVRVAASDAEVEVTRGELGSIRPGRRPRVDRVDDVYAFLSWMGGTMVFESTPLAEAAEEIERRFGRTVELTDSTLKDRRVTAWFTDRSFEEVVNTLCRVVGATCSIDATGATVGR